MSKRLDRGIPASPTSTFDEPTPFKDILMVPPSLEKVFSEVGSKPKEADRTTILRVLKGTYLELERELMINLQEPRLERQDILETPPSNEDLARYYSSSQDTIIREGIVEHAQPHISRVFFGCGDLAQLLGAFNPDLKGYDELLIAILDLPGKSIGLPSEQKRLMTIFEIIEMAALLHDIGNLGGKDPHTEIGAVSAYYLIDKLGFGPDVRNLVAAIIELHTKSPLCLYDETGKIKERILVLEEDSILGKKGTDVTKLLFDTASVLFLSDKLEIRGSRVLPDQLVGEIAARTVGTGENQHLTQRFIADDKPKLTINKSGLLKGSYRVEPYLFLLECVKEVTSYITKADIDDTRFLNLKIFLELVASEGITNGSLSRQAFEYLETVSASASNRLQQSMTDGWDERIVQLANSLSFQQNNHSLSLDAVKILLSTLPFLTPRNMSAEIRLVYSKQLLQATKIVSLVTNKPDTGLLLVTDLAQPDGIIFDSRIHKDITQTH